MTTTLTPMTRRSGGLGVHGVYAEAVDANGSRRRAFIAGPVLGMSTLAAGAKGARWTIDVNSSAENAQAGFTAYFATDYRELDVTAVLIDLTAVDVDRLKRGMTVSAIYPLQTLLEKAAAELAQEGSN